MAAHAESIPLPGKAPSFLEGAVSTDTAASRAATMWLSNPQNKMSLPTYSQKADTDGDGLLDQDEFKQLFDLDGDGHVDANEQAKAMKLFAMVDKARACRLPSCPSRTPCGHWPAKKQKCE